MRCMTTNSKNTIVIPSMEYDYLKKIERSFDDIFGYFIHLKEIEQARKEVKQKKYFSQEIAFKKLGI